MRRRIYLIFFMLCAFLCSVQAQKPVKVISFTETTDHISGAERRKDLNGNYCALVKVQVLDNIQRVEGNKIGSIVNRGVEKWVYMCRKSRNMRIHFQNHLPVRVVFGNYKVTELESNRVYELVIEIPDAQKTQPIDYQPPVSNTKQQFVLNYTPENATVLIDSKPYPGNGRIDVQLPTGEHTYLIAALGYSTAEGAFKLTEQAPRVITENLISDGTVVEQAQNTEGQGKDSKGKKKSKENDSKGKKKKEPKEEKVKEPKPKVAKEVKVEKVKKPKLKKEKTTTQQTAAVHGDKSLSQQELEMGMSLVAKSQKYQNVSFKFQYQGVTFKCKAQKGIVTITEFDVSAKEVTIPAVVSYNGNEYPVKTISTHINGNNYAANSVVIQDGIEVIKPFAFVEFRNLESVVIPQTITEIGKNAFRNNKNLVFHIPIGINENDLRSGRGVKVPR